MTFPLLLQHDQLPAVGVLQKLLIRTGATIKADGAFGPLSKKAVQDFQKPRGLVPDGAVGQITWPRVVAGEAKLAIIDCIDAVDPSLRSLEAEDIRKAGGTPILIFGQSNGVAQAVSEILRVAPRGGVFLLRFHGHGAKGVAGVSDGKGGEIGEHMSSIHPGNIDVLLPTIGKLRPIFSQYGCVQFMHCDTGGGGSGAQILRKISDVLGVPVSAGLHTQFGGGARTFRFEGATRTAVPNGQSLKDWSSSRPDFPGRSVI